MTQVNAAGAASNVNTNYETKKTNNNTTTDNSNSSNAAQGTSEDELVDLVEEEDSSEKTDETKKDGTETDNSEDTASTSSYLKMLYEKQLSLTKKIQRLAESMSVVMSQYNSTKSKIDVNASDKNVDTSQLQTNLSGYESRMSTLSSLISNCQSEIDGIASEINSILFGNTSTSSTSSTAAAAGTSSAQGTNGVSSAAAAEGAPEGYNSEKGQALANAATELYGSNPYSGGMCGSGVSASISRGLGLSISGNGCDYRDLLRADSHFKEVTDQYPTVESLYNLPAGAIVSWQPYNTTSAGSIYGHVYIADGKGNEISDFCAPMNNEHYANGGSYTVFIPV